MDLSKHLMDVFGTLSKDEKLLRLLYYKATDKFDDVLIKSDKRPNIIGNGSLINSGEYDDKAMTTNGIINDTIRLSKVVDDLTDDDPRCRVTTYLDALDIVTSANGIINKVLLNVNFTVDIYAHSDFEKIDFRLSKLVSRVYDLLYYKRITGMGEFMLTSSIPIDSKEELNGGYVGYRLGFKFSIGAPT